MIRNGEELHGATICGVSQSPHCPSVPSGASGCPWLLWCVGCRDAALGVLGREEMV